MVVNNGMRTPMILLESDIFLILYKARLVFTAGLSYVSMHSVMTYDTIIDSDRSDI